MIKGIVSPVVSFKIADGNSSVVKMSPECRVLFRIKIENLVLYGMDPMNALHVGFITVPALLSGETKISKTLWSRIVAVTPLGKLPPERGSQSGTELMSGKTITSQVTLIEDPTEMTKVLV